MKGIVYVRVDDRMIHGQIAAYWTNFLNVTRIMVVNDAASKDEVTRSILKMGTPGGVALSVLEVNKAAENISSGKYANQRVLLIFRTPQDAVRLYDKGIHFTKINVGNISGGAGKKMLTNTVSVNPEELEAIKQLGQRGIEVIWQIVPSQTEVDLLSIANKF